MDSIIERLNIAAEVWVNNIDTASYAHTCKQAADEIERLRAALEHIQSLSPTISGVYKFASKTLKPHKE